MAESNDPVTPGQLKVEICQRLGDNWSDLAIYCNIPSYEQHRFEHGLEAQAILDWLESQRRLHELPAALRGINRDDLANVWVGTQQTRTDQFYRDCIARWSGPRYALDTRFVQLTLLLDQGEMAQGPRWQVSERFRSLAEVLERVPDQAIVLLGSPGSGKSTLLRHYAMDQGRAVLDSGDVIQRTDALFCFWLSLNDYKAPRQGEPLPLPQAWLEACWARANPDLSSLTTLLREQRLTLLLDALNEIPHSGSEPARLWKEFLQMLDRDYPGNRVVFSCRSLDYSASLSSRELTVPQVRIEPLSDDQVREFVEHYCPEHAATLWANLEGSPQLDLLRTPYYLKLLVEQTVAGEIPKGRAALFTGFVRQALKREVDGDNPLFQAGDLLAERDLRRLTQGRWRSACELPRRGVLFDRLSALAYEMQRQHDATEASQIRIDIDDALELVDHERARDIVDAGIALGVLDEDLGREELLYVHQLLQEYFAAHRLAAAPEPTLLQVEWGANRASPSLQKTLASLPDADPLPPLPTTGWEETAVLAAAMVGAPDAFVGDLMAVNLPLAGRCAAQPDVEVSDTLKDRLCWRLVERCQDAAADLRARIAVSLALGELGDPRFERRTGLEGDSLLPPLIEVPAGTYTIGSDEGHFDNESPVHRVELAAFRIGKFPVTNAEWALFMQAGGYEDERWWVTEADRAWRRGDSTAEGPKRQWREMCNSVKDDFDRFCQCSDVTSVEIEHWEQIVQMSEEEFEALLEQWYPPGRQTQPANWNDDAYNYPTQPVVGICWYEARAYCAWLSAQIGHDFRLPPEVAWEATTRGMEGRRYAYGNNYDPTRCNTFDTHIRRTTPTGVFPGGETPDPAGIVDMTGNIWEWTSSLYQPYPYDTADGREAPSADESSRRVVRGGSWYGSPLFSSRLRALQLRPDDPRRRPGVSCVVFVPHFRPSLTAQVQYGLLRALSPARPARDALSALAADHLLELQEELHQFRYQPGAYRHFQIHDPKQRLISAAPFRDRVVHHALCNVIEPRFERRFIFDSYAHRPGKGTHRAVTRLQYFARRYRYVLRMDIVKHFPSIDHAILRHILAQVILEDDLLWLVDKILESGAGVLRVNIPWCGFPAMICSPPCDRAACPSAISPRSSGPTAISTRWITSSNVSCAVQPMCAMSMILPCSVTASASCGTGSRRLSSGSPCCA
jgi:formylglycine-generating enzyme required for sulfatase activity